MRPESASLGGELRNIFRSIVVLSPTTLTCNRRQIHVNDWDSAGPGPMFGSSAIPPRMLWEYLYLWYYSRPWQDGPAEEPGSEEDIDESIFQELSEANMTESRPDPGWQIQNVLGGNQILVQKHGAFHVVPADRFEVPQFFSGPLTPGLVGSVRMPKEWRIPQTAFYAAFGSILADREDPGSFVRLYWNVSRAGAPILLKSLSGALNSAMVPFRMKFVLSESQYSRLDAAVLYLPKRFFQPAWLFCLKAHDEVAQHLGDPVPLFTKPLLPGLALAEDPGTGESFGQSRCRLLAEAIWAAFSHGLQTEEARLREIRNGFARRGLNLDQPYLCTSSVDIYEPPVPALT